MIKLYGLKNCDTCRKARNWLKEQSIDYTFIDLRAEGVNLAMLEDWEARVNWEALLNRQSTTWRGLTEVEKADLNRELAISLMLTYPTLIKRPILVHQDNVWLGFSPERYAELS
jgi:arsenate reductase